MTNEETVLAYHEATKHHFHRYARSPGYLDWANQPDPFRRYAGAPQIRLPLHERDTTPAYDEIYRPGAVAPHPVNAAGIGLFFECSLAISAWKQYLGNRWALRCNPSSGNLHPTEGYLVAGPLEGLTEMPGVYHYAPKEHTLERRTAFDAVLWEELSRGLPGGSFFAGLTSIHWREAWKYGERAYRYCQHDIGHALAALRLAAAMLGWRATLLDALGDAEVAALLGVDRDDGHHNPERETPGLLLAVCPREPSETGPSLSSRVIRQIAAGAWLGTANRLSKNHVDWAIIDAVASACGKSAAVAVPRAARTVANAGAPARGGLSALRVFQQRRSAVDLDGVTRISRETFYRILARTVPGLTAIPWDVTPPPAHVHLGLFVHRVDGVPPGLYALVREPAALDPLREAMNPAFRWERPVGCPPNLPLYRLEPGDCCQVATSVCCGQDIAGDGVFSAGMLAEFEPIIKSQGAWFYRRLFWETGMIGQVLYLEAEAAGIRGTGIGCFFDDSVHELFGLRDRRHQSLYHFTLGGPVEDPRLMTLPPYGGR